MFRFDFDQNRIELFEIGVYIERLYLRIYGIH